MLQDDGLTDVDPLGDLNLVLNACTCTFSKQASLLSPCGLQRASRCCRMTA
jgi:hypothetical protein